MNKTIGLHFGALADSISDQLTKQGFGFDKEQVEHFEKVSDALTMVSLSDLIPDSVKEKANQKLYKKVVAHVCKHNKLKMV